MVLSKNGSGCIGPHGLPTTLWMLLSERKYSHCPSVLHAGRVALEAIGGDEGSGAVVGVVSIDAPVEVVSDKCVRDPAAVGRPRDVGDRLVH